MKNTNENQAEANAAQEKDPKEPTTKQPNSKEVNLEEDLAGLNIEHEALRDQHLRLKAEFENFKRRTQKERLDLLTSANASLLKKLLPIIDDFERALASNGEKPNNNAAITGMQLIYGKLTQILQKEGLTHIETQSGEKFDGDFHEAITQAPTQDPKLKGAVIEVIEKGYTLNGKVVRFAKVIIGA